MSDLIDDDWGDVPGPGGNTPEYSVSGVSGAIKRTLEDSFGRIRVKGEVGRVFRARSGHLYFDLKDDRSVLAAVSWKGQISRLTVPPEEGMEVVATGTLTTFSGQSKYQLTVDDVEPAGVGALMAMLEKRKAALAAEGLFEPSRKRPLPFLPRVIGVVTSPGGAVIRDILHRLSDRFPRHVLVWPVAVQGRDCAPQVTAAIKGFNALQPGGPIPRPDLLIVARGGGSIEDLWGFNEEIVARAAAASEIPLISAVGHETDTTLIDYVSDQRAPTPTAAAEMAVPVRLDLLAHVEALGARLTGATARNLSRRGERLRDLGRALPAPASLVGNARQRLDLAALRLPAALSTGVTQRRLHLARLMATLRPATLAARLRGEATRLAALDARRPNALIRATTDRRRRFDATAQRLSTRLPLREVARQREALSRLTSRADRALASLTRQRRDALIAADRVLSTLSYEATLARGYAVVRDTGGAVLTTQAEAEKATGLEIQFQDGRLPIGKSVPPSAPPKRSRKATEPPPEQGDLF